RRRRSRSATRAKHRPRTAACGHRARRSSRSRLPSGTWGGIGSTAQKAPSIPQNETLSPSPIEKIAVREQIAADEQLIAEPDERHLHDEQVRNLQVHARDAGWMDYNHAGLVMGAHLQTAERGNVCEGQLRHWQAQLLDQGAVNASDFGPGVHQG